MIIAYFNYMSHLYGYSIGSTIKAERLLTTLQALGHQVHFYWWAEGKGQGDGGQKTNRHRLKWLRIFLYTPRELLRNFIDIYREWGALKMIRPQVLIARLDAFRISPLFVARLHNIPLVVEADGANSYEWLTFNGGPHLWPWVLRKCEKMILKYADGIFAQSNITKQYFLQQHTLSAEKIIVITNGADQQPPVNRSQLMLLRRSLKIPREAEIIGFVGSLHHWHGVAEMASVIKELLSAYPHVLFLFVGGGGALESQVKRFGNDGPTARVVFTGSVPYQEVHKYIHLFDIAVAPYPPMEVFYFSPMKVFEYMAAAKPIVAAGIGQIAEYLQHGETALLYEAGNLTDLKEQIILLLNDKKLRRKLGANAYRVFLQQHTWMHKAKQLDQYLEHIRQLKADKDGKN